MKNKIILIEKYILKFFFIIICILFMIFGVYLISEWFNPFNIFEDLNNPTATFFDVIISTVVTCFAIYKTSELDREVRMQEHKVKFFNEKLIYVYNNKMLSFKADEYFFNNELSCKSTTYNNIMKSGFELKKYNEVIYELILLNSSLTEILKNLYKINQMYIGLYEFLSDKVLYFYQLNEGEKCELFPFFKEYSDNINIDINQFVNFYISKNNLQVDIITSQNENIKMYSDLILKEFAFDEKL